LVEDVHEAAQRPGQPVDPVDEEDVEPAGFGGGQRPLQGGSFQGGAGLLVAVDGADEFPSGLDLDVGAQLRLLGLQGEGLVFLVGGDADVDRDPQRAGGNVVAEVEAGGGPDGGAVRAGGGAFGGGFAGGAATGGAGGCFHGRCLLAGVGRSVGCGPGSSLS